MNRKAYRVISAAPAEWDERRREMVKVARVALLMAVGGLVGLLAAAPSAQALSTADKPASILVWPKIVVDSNGLFGTCSAPLGRLCSDNSECAGDATCRSAATDTLIQLSNTSTTSGGGSKQAHCFYINANSHCANDPRVVCQTAAQCSGGAACVPGWSEIDFDVVLTRDQPLGWYASSGLQHGDFPLEGAGVCSTPPGRACSRNSDCGFPNGVCNVAPSNLGSSVPPVPEDPFVGSLKCIEFDPAANPPVPDHTTTRNTLKGEASIMLLPGSETSGVDVRKYNAIGLQATATASAPTNVLQIGNSTGGDTGKEYEACPSTLILNHLFDGATDPMSVGLGANSQTGVVRTDLTLVPCGDDFLNQIPGRVTAQFLVFNEFEQRFSGSKTVDCFLESQLSLLDTPNWQRSIFSAGVSGTIAGQTRIRGVGSAPTGRGLLGVAQLLVRNNSTQQDSGAAYNLHQQGDPGTGTAPDLITFP